MAAHNADLPVLKTYCGHPLVKAGWAGAAVAPSGVIRSLVRDVGRERAGDHPRWSVVEDVLPPVDTRLLSPEGFRPDADGGVAILRPHEGTRGCAWKVVDTDGNHAATLDTLEGIGEGSIASLRRFTYLDVDTRRAHGPVAVATLLSVLACAGVPVRVTNPLPTVVTQMLGPVGHRITTLTADIAADPLERESWSVSVRREALSRFSLTARWRRFASRSNLPVVPTSSVSVILPTKRAGNLRFALEQVSRQSWGEVEAVVALHGVSARDPEINQVLSEYPGPIQTVELDSAVIFGDVLNAALDRCSGQFVAKMDDDDWYGPNHLTDLLLAHHYSGATLVGLADHFVYLDDEDVTLRDVEHGTERRARRLSGGTLLISRADLLTLGRWRPVFRAVDRCLIQAVRAASGSLYAIHDLGFCLYRGSGDHTWNPSREHFRARNPESWAGFQPPPQLEVRSIHSSHPSQRRLV